MAKGKGEKKETHYDLRCICVNCGNDFNAKILKGIEVSEIGGEIAPALRQKTDSKEFIRCPNCDTNRVRKRLSLADVK